MSKQRPQPDSTKGSSRVKKVEQVRKKLRELRAVGKQGAKSRRRDGSYWGRLFRRDQGQAQGLGTSTQINARGITTMLSEQMLISVASNAVYDLVKEAFDGRKHLQARFGLRDDELFSSRLSLNTRVPRRLRDEAEDVKYEIRAIIQSIAEEIEQAGYESVEEALNDHRLISGAKIRAEKIVRGHFRLQVSYNSMSVALRLLCDANNKVLRSAAQFSQDTRKQTEFLLRNSILVIEIVDAIIAFLETFKLEGLKEIEDVCEEIESDLAEEAHEDAKFKTRLETDDMLDVARKQRTLGDIAYREEFREKLREKWKQFLRSARQAQENVELFRSKTVDLEILRTNAERQLRLLQVVAITGAMQDSIKAVQDLLDIEEIELKRLTPTLLQELLGVDG